MYSVICDPTVYKTGGILGNQAKLIDEYSICRKVVLFKYSFWVTVIVNSVKILKSNGVSIRPWAVPQEKKTVEKNDASS